MLHKLPFNTQRSNLLNEVSHWVTFAFPSSSPSGPAETLRFSESLSKCECDIADFLRGHGSGSISSTLPQPQGWVSYRLPWLLGVCWILTDTVCDLQRQAEQMSVMRSPWAPGLRPTFKPDLSLSLSLSTTQTNCPEENHKAFRSMGMKMRRL